jgi:hypothetical protein
MSKTTSPPYFGPERPEDAIANAIWALRLAYPWRAVVLVEGDDDAHLLERHVDLTRCSLEVMHGRPRVIEVLHKLRARPVVGVVSVVDADYDRLLGTPIADPDVIVTDTHDIETTLFRSAALDHVLRELGERGLVAVVGDARARILKAAAHIGAARLVCRKKGWSVQFEGVDYEEFVDAKTLEVNPQALIRSLSGRQAGTLPQHRMTDEAAALVEREVKMLHPYWDLCQGHDVASILSIALRRLLGTRRKSEVDPERLELELRLAFDSSDFRASHLHASLRAWEARNSGFRVVP